MKTAKGSGPVLAALAILLSALTMGCGSANKDARFFSGKTLTIIVPHGEGGMDSYARALAPYVQTYLHASRVIVRNVPTDGGIVGRNDVFEAKPDGLTLGFTTSAGSLLAEWSGDREVRYKSAEFSYLGRLNGESHVLIASPRSKLADLADLARADRVVMGFAGVAGDDYYISRMAADLLGFRIRPKTDYLTADEAILSCVKGDIDAVLLSYSSLKDQIEAGTVVPLLVFGPARMAALPSVPTVFENVPTEKRELMGAVVKIYALDRTLFGPPLIPAGRLAALRGALDRAVSDPGFRSDMKALGRPMDFLDGADTAALLETILSYQDRIKPLVLAMSGGSD